MRVVSFHDWLPLASDRPKLLVETQKIAEERAVQLLDSACEVTKARTEKVASEERLQAIVLVNKDLLAQLGHSNQEWKSSAAEMTGEIATLRAQLAAAKEQAELESDSLKAAIAVARGETARAVEQAAAAEKAALGKHASFLREVSELESSTKMQVGQREEMAGKVAGLQERLAEALAGQEALRVVIIYNKFIPNSSGNYSAPKQVGSCSGRHCRIDTARGRRKRADGCG
jgi:hypothetical protein